MAVIGFGATPPCSFHSRVFRCCGFAEYRLSKWGRTTNCRRRKNAGLALKDLGAHVDVQEGHIVSVWLDGSRELTDKDLVHLESLTELKSLSISKMIDPSLQHLVTHKAASGEDITDDGLKSIRGLRNLETLALFNLTGIDGEGLAHLGELRNLKRVYLKGTPVGDNVAHLKGLQSIEVLGLSDTGVTENGLLQLKQLSRLKSLLLSEGTVLSEVGIRHVVETWPDLESLTIRTSAGDAAVEHLKHLSKLNTLGLGINVSNGGLQNIAKLPLSLTTLWLLDAKISGEGLRYLSEMPQLTTLGVRGAPISSDGLSELKRLRRLEVLDLSRTEVSDDDLVNLKELSGLTQLRLSDCKITDKGLAHLVNMKELSSVQLDSTGVSKEGAKRLKASLPKCTITIGSGESLVRL